MGKSSPQTTTSTNQPPQAVLDAYNALIQRGTSVANVNNGQAPTYSGQTVAPLNQTQNAAIQNITNAQGVAQPYFDQAQQYVQGATTPAYQTVQNYLNPYTQQVVDTTQANINENNALQQQQLLGKAIASGASPFGGDRAGVAAAELARQQNLASQQTIAGLENQGYQGALSAAQQGAELQAQGGYLEGALGQQALGAALQPALAQLQAGTQAQQTTQNQLNSAYQQWQQQQAYPFQTTQWLGGLTEGLGSASGGTGTTSAPGASPLQSIAGGALAGAGTGALIAGPYGAGIGAIGGGLLGGLSSINFKDGGRAKGYDGGGAINQTPGLLANGAPWIPNMNINIEHTLPRPPAAAQNKQQGLSQEAGYGALALNKGLGKGTDLGDAMPWLNGTGGALPAGAVDLGDAMPWLAGAKDGGAIGFAQGGLAAILKDPASQLTAPFADLTSRDLESNNSSQPKAYADGGYDEQQFANEDSDYNNSLSGQAVQYAMNQLNDPSSLESNDQIVSDDDNTSDDSTIEAGALPIVPQGGLGAAQAPITPKITQLPISRQSAAQPTAQGNNAASWAIPLIAAGAGIASHPGPGAIGAGLEAGLGAYGSQQKAQLEAQAEKAREKHYENMDNKPVQIKGTGTIKLMMGDKILDTGLPEAKDTINQQRLDIERQRLAQGKYTAIPTVVKDPDGTQRVVYGLLNSATGEIKPTDAGYVGKGGSGTGANKSPQQLFRDEANKEYEAVNNYADATKLFNQSINAAGGVKSGPLAPYMAVGASALSQLTGGMAGNQYASNINTAQKIGTQAVLDKLSALKSRGVQMARLIGQGSSSVTNTPEANQNIEVMAEGTLFTARQKQMLANNWQNSNIDPHEILAQYEQENTPVLTDKTTGQYKLNTQMPTIDKWLATKGLSITGSPATSQQNTQRTIPADINDRIQKAKAAGYSDAEIQQLMQMHQ